MKDSLDKMEILTVMVCYTIRMANFVIQEAGRLTLFTALEFYIMRLLPK